MEQRDPVGREQLAQLAEKHWVLVDPDMLEHADRDDAVVAAPLLAVIAQVKAHPLAEARRAHEIFASGAVMGKLLLKP